MASSPTTSTDLTNLANAQARMLAVLDDPRKFTNDCEEIFDVFRRAVVRLRNDKKTLDELENKETPVSFMCKFCKARPPQANRCKEVLGILMLSDEWKKKFKADPEVESLPAAIAEQLGDDKEDNSTGSSIAAVVQRYTKAQVLIDEKEGTWMQVGRGLMICIDFTADASPVKIRSAARSLLNAPLSSGTDRKSLESVAALSKRGEEQTVLVILQTSLLSTLTTSDAGEIGVEKACVEADVLQKSYDSFIEQLKEFAKEGIDGAAGARLPRIAANNTSSSQSWEVCSDGFMHSFTF